VSIISVFFIILIVVFAVIAYLTEPSKTDKLIHARVVALDHRVAVDETEDGGIVKEITFSRILLFDRFLRKNKIALSLQVLIDQAQANWTVGRFVFATLSAVGVGAILGNWWIASNLLGWAPGLVLGLAPYVYLVQKRKLRFRKFAALLPEAIDLMSRCLRSGQALQSTLEVVASEISDPLGSEFRRASDEQSFGLPFREAMLNLVKRMPLPDMQFVVTAMLVQKETGGNLVQILDKTSYLIRERNRVEGQLRIRTAQGRLTGWILCALPIAIFFGMNVLSPGYGKILFDDPKGQQWVAAAGVMMVLGMLLIRKIVNVKV
jgi:tight adherence protein B